MHKFLIGAVATVAAVGVAVFCGDCPGRGGCRRPSPQAPLVATPDRDVDAITRRMRAKRELALQIVTMRVPLLVAVDLFREANGPTGLLKLAELMEGDSLHDKLCRQVIAYAAACESDLRQAGQQPAGPSHAATLREEFERCRTTRTSEAELPTE